MKSNIAITALVIVFAATLLVNVAATAQARDAACSFARAAGTYGFSTSGTVVGVGSRVSTGIITLDRAGNATGNATSSLNGTIAGETFSGTYTVNSGCTTTLTAEIRDLSGQLLLTVTEDGAWDDNMREIRGIFTSATLPSGTQLPVVITVEAKKQ
jgi:hypothetical protein